VIAFRPNFALACPPMNFEKIKQDGPSYPQYIYWGFSSYCKYLVKHPEYEISEGDILIYCNWSFSRRANRYSFGHLHATHRCTLVDSRCFLPRLISQL